MKAIKSWPEAEAHQKNEGRDRSHNSLVQRLDPRLNRDNRLFESLSRKVSAMSPCYARGTTTTATAVGLIDGFDDEGAARQKMRKARGYMTDGDAHLPIYPPCSSRPLSLLSVISRGPVVRPYDLYRCFSRGRKSVAHRIRERWCYTARSGGRSSRLAHVLIPVISGRTGE